MATLKSTKKKSSAKVKSLFTKKEIIQMGKDYADISAKIKKLDEEKKTLSSGRCKKRILI